jgi:Sec-independent protein translocase protein TatA
VGIGTELLFLVVLGLMVLGPRRMYTVLGYLGRAKAEFDKSSRAIKSQVSAELQHASQDGESSSTAGSQPD